MQRFPPRIREDPDRRGKPARSGADAADGEGPGIPMLITGAILLIVNFCQKKFVLEKGEVEIPKGKKFGTVMLNVGMILYSIFWIGMIVVQLFS